MIAGRLLALAAAGLFALSACSLPVRNAAVPYKQEAQAAPIGLTDVRYVVGNAADMARFRRDVADTWVRERAWRKKQGLSGALPPSALLALSGGGDNGAFGAGLLNGWTQTGKRPEFLLVTGISTGALIAPFAFLGPAYDAKLKALYTTSSPRDIIEIRSVFAALTDDALADTAPLRRLLQKHVDRAFLDAVAVEYDKGRELWVSTTNLDARQRVIWNLTKVARSRDPRALDLFHDIMIASAAIPGAFPPVMIDVSVDGKAYQEMHVDGGAMAQVFVYPPSLDLEQLADEQGGKRKRALYVVMNARLDPEWAETERSVLSIAQRSIDSMIHSQGVGDLYRIYLTAQRDNLDFNLAFIPDSFEHAHREEFDTDYMRALYETGYNLAAKGYVWEKAPPDYQTSP
jgi:predicted patatin/cPLA2 family phospholipase